VLWARSLLHSGAISITEGGRWDDSSVYYPNTVPKPFELLQAAAAESLGGGAAHAALRTALGCAAVLAVTLSVRKATGSGRMATGSGLLLAANPAFVMLCISGSPAIPFIALLSCTSPAAAAASCLVRPEGFLYAVIQAASSRRWRQLLPLIPLAAAWPALNAILTGNPLWSAFEVRYAVSAMQYYNPGPLGFWPWAAVRGLMVMGPLLLLAILLKPAAWPRAAGGAAHLAMLSVSLAFGSLALPRYVDQVFLLGLPWAPVAGARLPIPRKRIKAALAAAAAALSLAMWPSTLDQMRLEHRLGEELDRAGREGWQGRMAANELLVPRIALAAGMDDPRYRFASTDRMAWEGRAPGSLGVTRVVTAPGTIYSRERAERWIESFAGLDVEILDVGGGGGR